MVWDAFECRLMTSVPNAHDMGVCAIVHYLAEIGKFSWHCTKLKQHSPGVVDMLDADQRVHPDPPETTQWIFNKSSVVKCHAQCRYIRCRYIRCRYIQ